MSATPTNAIPPRIAEAEHGFAAWRAQIVEWFREEGAWWLTSLVVHTLGLCLMALITIKVADRMLGNTAAFDEAKVDDLDAIDEVPIYELGDIQEDTSFLSPDTLLEDPLGQPEQKEEYYDESEKFVLGGGGGTLSNLNLPQIGGVDGGFSVVGVNPGGPATKGGSGVGAGTSNLPFMGLGTDGSGFGGRAEGSRKEMLGKWGGTKTTERAVAAALNWFARHQNQDGSWTQDGFQKHCKSDTCTGAGMSKQDVGTTALGLLPFLGAGQTHKSKGTYQNQVAKAVAWLLRQQDPRTGDLRGNGGTMYAHALATLALCEIHGMTKGYGGTGDPKIQEAAQKAIAFIQSAQNPETGGWRYVPGDRGDTSVGGWMVMALKSAQMAGLSVNPAIFEGAKKYLGSVASGYNNEHFSYQPRQNATLSMTAVGLLCSQYLGAKRNDAQMVDGCEFLMEPAHLPDAENIRHIYYWYYATMVMHNVTGPQWDAWNRQMRKVVCNSQVRVGCAAGSWDPALPTPDQWGSQGGRIMETALSALTLEVYYRYLPLYKLDTEDEAKLPPAAVDRASKRPDNNAGKDAKP
jgi:hypothetical protein